MAETQSKYWLICDCGKVTHRFPYYGEDETEMVVRATERKMDEERRHPHMYDGGHWYVENHKGETVHDYRRQPTTDSGG